MSVRTAVILAGGQGLRLDAFHTAKPLVTIGGVPLIVHTIHRLQEAGVTKIIIVTPPRDVAIKKELIDRKDITADVHYIEQLGMNKGILDSFIALRQVEKHVREPFFVTVCDLITKENFYSLFQGRESAGVSMLVARNKVHGEQAGASYRVKLKDETQIASIEKERTDFDGFDVGVYVFTPESSQKLADLAVARDQITLAQALEILSEQESLTPVFYDGADWFDVNTPEIAVRAELLMQEMQEHRQMGGAQEMIPLQPLSAADHFTHKKEIQTDIFIEKGLLSHPENFEIIPSAFIRSPHHILVDKKVDALYGERLETALRAQGFLINRIVVDSGEQTKSINRYVELAERLLGLGVDKQSILISLGGGVINNLTGFLAATLYRGIGLIHIPTTVMSQCDAAIGLKQGINGDKGKNLLGSYYEPLRIIVDPEVLLTLDERWIRDGLSECIKHALVQDKEFFSSLMEYVGDIKNVEFLEFAIRKNIKLKTILMEQDYHEDREALALQYGHEIGHAVEYLSGYKFGHGESIAIGMRVSAEMSHLMGFCSEETVKAHIGLLEKYGLPTWIPASLQISDILNLLKYNKKFVGGSAEFALCGNIGTLKDVGGVYRIPCNMGVIQKALEKSYATK